MAKRPRINDSNDPLNKSDLVLTGLEQVSQSTSQQSNKSTTKPNPNSSSQNNDNLTSIESNKSNSQVANKLSLRKSTFQISEPVLERLEKVHLGLQLQFGKANAPYKEVIVEEALVQLLEQLEQPDSSRNSSINLLKARQQLRSKRN